MSKPIVTFACLNNVSYTKQLLISLAAAGVDRSQVVAVDNASNDQTPEVLSSAGVHIVSNKRNLGCGVAWNQGILFQQAKWTVVMNNDVIVQSDWLRALIEGAEAANLLIASPAMIEGPLSYDFGQVGTTQSKLLQGHVRRDTAHAVCMAIHESVFQKIGYFQAKPSLLGFEDTLFFHKAHKAQIPMGIIGGSWIHHFGSITQKWLKEEMGIPQGQGLGNPRNKLLLNESWLERKIRQYRKKRLIQTARKEELLEFQATVHGLARESAEIEWI
jgi:GT2 family glycosyltransferase